MAVQFLASYYILYYISYRDYVKNVASSEIYATWPESTITANVLAIMSFTLIQKIGISPKETKRISLELGFEAMRTLTKDYKWVIEPQKYCDQYKELKQ